jgi:hypothetical protein
MALIQVLDRSKAIDPAQRTRACRRQIRADKRAEGAPVPPVWPGKPSSAGY